MYNLSKPQKLIYDMEKYAGGAVSVICGSMIVRGTKGLPELKTAVNELYRLNDAFRMHIVETSSGVRQVVNEFAPYDAEVLRFSSRDELDSYGASWAKEPMDLYGSLCEIKLVLLSDSYGLLVKLHHIIADAWTLSLLGTQFNVILSGEVPAVYSYTEYLGREKTYMESNRCAKDRAFFLEQFKECDEVTYLSEQQNSSLRSNRKTFVIKGEQANSVIAYTKEHGASPFVLFITVLATYMSRTRMNVEKFYIGTAVLNRTGPQEKNTAGMFINTAPVLMQLDNSASFAENLSKVKKASFSVFRHQKYNYGDVLTDIRKEYGFAEKLYDVMFSYQNATITGADGAMESTWYHSGSQAESLQVHIDDRDSEGIFRIHYDYQVEKFSEAEIEQMHQRIASLLLDAVGNDGKKLCELEILPETEKRTLLVYFNDTAVDYPRDKCIHTLFEEQAERTPDKTAVIACDRTLTYRELNEQANRIAHSLIGMGIGVGDIVAFALPRRSYLITTMFGILKAGAAYLPVDPDYPQDRIDYMLQDSQAKLFITEENILGLLKNDHADNPAIAQTNESLCYCIYTSGTTGKPKGTLISHHNVVNFVQSNDANDFQKNILNCCDYFVAANSISFDITLQEIHLPLLNGRSSILLSDEQAYNIGKSVHLLKGKRCGLIITPTKLGIYMADQSFCDCLRNVAFIMCGAEPFPQRLRQQIRQYTNAVIFNGYGPTETTCGVLYSNIEDGADITIGKPIANTQIYIVDRNMQLVPIGVTGELCIAGDGVGAGYLNHPELTAEKFIDNPFEKGKLYKTGDLAYWREDGNIVYVGRNDFQVKIRGLRIELGEIESTISSVNGVSQAVVVVRKDDTGRQLICAFYAENAPVAVGEIKAAIHEKLPRYMMPHSFTLLPQMPLTPSGKINRKGLPEVDLSAIASTAEYIAPQTEQQKVLASAIEAVLGIEQVGIEDNFFDLGGDSLKAIQLIAKLEQMGYHTETRTIFSCGTVQELAKQLIEAHAERTSAHFTGDVPATPAQLRVYTAQSVDSSLTTYNIPYIFKATDVDTDRLQKTVSELIDRHEILRTHFENRDGIIIQVVEEHVPFEVEEIANDDIPAFIRPFDLAKAPLFRVGCAGNTVIVDMHHIITDGGSMPIFFRELNELYMGRQLGEVPVQYRQFAMQKNDYTESEKYWLSVFNDELPELELNTDCKRKEHRSFNGNAMYDSIDLPLHQKILQKCKSLNITPYVFYMGGFNILLSKFSGNEDIAVGMPISGRESGYLNTIGMFVNTIALRSRPMGTKSVKTYLNEVKDTSISAIIHQNYPYGDLVKKLNANTAGRNPLFDVMFAYQSEAMTQVIFNDQKAELLPTPITTSKYDFTFNIMPMESSIAVMVEYCTDLYRESTIQRLIEGYRLVLVQMLNDSALLKDISAMSVQEKHRLLVEFNDTAMDYPRDKCVHALFEEQAAQTPEKIAVIAYDKTLTYRELNEQANRIAHSLIEMGIGVGDIVAFALPRRSYLIATMFGILKAGAAYLPVDPDYPQDRIDNMLQDSQAKLFITEENIFGLLKNDHTDNPAVPVNGSDPFCALHTSGSTGTPKISLLKRAGIRNWFFANRYVWDGVDAAVSATILTFDAFMIESILTLAHGCKVIFASENDIFNQTDFEKLFDYSHQNLFFSTPTKLKNYIDNSLTEKFVQNIKSFIVGGEIFDDFLFSSIKSNAPQCRVYNCYGPTETSICSTIKKVDNTDITIGKPIANTQIYIVDRNMQLVPIGVTGELCIAGDGVGAGYLNRPELTAEKFVDNPFGEGKLYRTGDLAYWREDGNIVYVGRNDFQVKIRGLRIELGEIESTISSVSGVSQAVVVVRKDDTGRQLICAFYTENAPVAVGEIKAAIQEKLPRYMMPHSFTLLPQMPLTPSGKINRKSLPEIDLSTVTSNVEYVAPQTPTEEKLSTIWGELLSMEQVSRTDDFFELGGDSLLSISLLSKLESSFDVVVSIKDMFEHPVLEQLAVFIDRAQGHQEKIVALGAQRYTLLPQQLAIYAVCNKDPQTLAYNMPARIEWSESIDKERLKACIRRLFELHPELKTSIHSDEGVVYAAFDADAQVTFEEYTEQNAQDFVRPFNLSKAPLLRVGFTETAMLFDTHHIVVDGESVNIILRDLAELYQGGIPQKSEFSYADYASHFQTADFEEHKAYFKSMLKCDFEPLALPEKKNPSNAEGISLFYQIEKATFEKGRQIARANKMTDTMVFLGAFGILLSKYTARTDILSSVVVTNRVHKEVQGITGMFVNTLPVMLHVEGTTADYLAYVRDLMLNLYKYQELPFFEAAEAVGMNDKNVVNTSFVYQADGAKQVTIGNTQLTPAWIDTHTTKFDLTVELTPNENSCTIRIEYNSGKYEKALIDRLFEGYLRVIDQLGKEELKDISVLSDGEYQKVIYDFNDTAVEYPRDKCVHTLFEEQATKMPDKVALVFENKQFTYRQLNEMSNSLAHFLREKGVGRNDIVSIIAKRSWHIIVAMLGILKAGGAYMPVDPAYPKGRIEYMLDTAQCRIALTFGYEESLGIETVLLDSFDFMAQTAPVGNVNRSEDFCYIIFTSGSTGKPKGVSICHQNVLNYCDNNDNNVCCSIIEANHQSIVSVTNIIFDIFVTESLLPLLNGITIYFANDEQVFSQERLGQLVEANAVDVMQTTPTKMRSYIMDKQNVAYLKTLRAIILGGEALPVDLYQELCTYTTARIFNIYGPAETTVWSTNKKMEGDDITIGKPIANTQVYILDRHHQPLPVGVAGELCISGDGVGKGYLNRPELTAEKFIPNPFLPGKTMYCTGDLARWRDDGEIEYLGRIDTQVKIRGLRIELGEIESVMSSFDGISLTAVADKRDQGGRQYLVGYYIAHSAIDEKVLRQHLSTKLPKYMVPNYFVQLDEMPMTPSGKTDRKNLPMPEFASQAREYVPPKTKQEKMLCNMLSKLFNMESVGITDDFFELGGDSLRAIEYTAKAHHAGINFSLQNVFDYPTVESLCKYLQVRPSKETIFTAEQFQKYAPILQKNTWNPVFIPQRCEMGSVLLTGATGFLGAHILDALMKHGIKKIYCLVRGSEEKLLQRLNYYFGEQYANSVGTSIIPVIGDLEDESVTGSLPERVGYVIHAAASVKHYGSWQYFKSANVDGTKRIVTYAKKVGARLIHISTISVSGNAGADQMELYVSEEEKHFYESSLYIDQPLNNVYIRSKFEAEMLVLDAMLEGLQANIIRVGNLTNRKSDSKFQPNYAENAFLTRVKAMLSLGCLPDYLMPLYSEFSPVDSTAEAIVTIAEHMNDQYTIFHANSNQNLYFDRMLEYLDRLARPMKVVSGEQFVKRIRDTIDSQQSYVYEALSNDLDEEDQLQYDTHIHIENEFTVQYLQSLGFQWPEIDYAYVEGYLRYFTQLGYFGKMGGEMSSK